MCLTTVTCATACSRSLVWSQHLRQKIVGQTKRSELRWFVESQMVQEQIQSNVSQRDWSIYFLLMQCSPIWDQWRLLLYSIHISYQLVGSVQTDVLMSFFVKILLWVPKDFRSQGASFKQHLLVCFPWLQCIQVTSGCSSLLLRCLCSCTSHVLYSHIIIIIFLHYYKSLFQTLIKLPSADELHWFVYLVILNYLPSFRGLFCLNIPM